MFLKKNIAFVGLLIITSLLITGCDWSGCCKKGTCDVKEKETVIILENDEQVASRENKLDDSDDFEEENEK